jgi:glycosyltransferase involved in cell wall biosynthesis
MKVGVYFPSFPPEAGGGYTFEQDILTSLINLASQSHHHFTIYFENESLSDAPAIANHGNLKTVLLEQPARVSNSHILLRKAAEYLGWKRQIGETESPFQKAAGRDQIEFVWFPTPIYNPIEIPYIATMWDIQHRIQPWFPEVSRMGEWAHREAYYSTYLRQAAYIITPNQAGMKELSFIYQIPPERFRLLPHPTPETGQLSSKNDIINVLQKYQIPSDYLFYPAQFWAHKNHANLLLALKSLLDNYQIIMHLVLVGSNQGNLQYIQDLVEQLGLKDQVHFLGFIPRKDLIALYCGAFALVYVTLFGPENLPPLEAFVCGCPVIASNIAGAQEQLGDAALLVNGLAPEEIALAIKKIRDDPTLRNNFIQKGHVRAANFTGPGFVRGVFEILDEFEPVRRNWK